jgi:hypothetical protein
MAEQSLILQAVLSPDGVYPALQTEHKVPEGV